MINYPQYKQLPENYIKAKIQDFFAEDMPNGDVTTDLTVTEDEIVTAEIQAEEDLIFAGETILPVFFDEKSFKFELFVKDGFFVGNGEIIGRIRGKKSSILKIERTMLNLLQRICGIATHARKYSELAEPYKVKILDTRKTAPGLRLFDKYAVAAGGGFNHRLDLSSGILIKDNHISGKDLKNSLLKVKENNKSNLPIELEVDNFEQLKIGLEIGVDGFLLDNFSPKMVQDAVTLIRSTPNGNEIFVEASGGINLSNIEPYLSTGINAISIGALTHTVKSSNIHLEFK